MTTVSNKGIAIKAGLVADYASWSSWRVQISLEGRVQAMRKLIASVVATAALLISGMANAAQVDLFLTRLGTASAPEDNWALTANVTEALKLAAVSVQITSGGVGSFVLAQPASVIDPFIPTGFSFISNVSGLTRLGMGPGTNLFMVQGPVVGFLIGTFTGVGPIQLLEGNALDGDTATDENFGALTFTLTTRNYAPEPGAMVLLGIGLGALSLVRRKSA